MENTDNQEKWVLMTELNGEPLIHHFKLSSHGNVVKIKKGQGPEEKFNPKNIGGYQYISFTTTKGSRETIYVHRLVAEFFVENASDYAFVIHVDYDRRNNKSDNLRWVSSQELYSHRGAKAGRTPGKTNKRSKLLKLDGPTNEADMSKKATQRRMISDYVAAFQ